MSEQKSKLSHVADAAGALAAAGTMMVGGIVAKDGINTLESLPPKPAPTASAEFKESPAEQARSKAWQEIMAGTAGVVIGAGGVVAVAMSRRADANDASEKAWGSPVKDTPKAIAQTTPPQHQTWTQRHAAGLSDKDSQGQQQQ